jgi:hypothetical protein
MKKGQVTPGNGGYALRSGTLLPNKKLQQTGRCRLVVNSFSVGGGSSPPLFAASPAITTVDAPRS